MDDAFGEEPRGGKLVGGPEQLGAVVLGPHVEAAGALEAVGEDLELLVGGDGEERGRGGSLDGLPGALELRRGGAELGALAHLVDLALAAQAGLEELLGLLVLHALPLPLGHAARVGPGPAAHADRRPWLLGRDGVREPRGFGEEEALRRG